MKTSDHKKHPQYICTGKVNLFTYAQLSQILGSVSVLPTCLHLTIGVLREMAAKESKRKTPTVVAACLSTLKILCTSPFLEDDSIHDDWIKLLQSALATILHHAKPCK